MGDTDSIGRRIDTARKLRGWNPGDHDCRQCPRPARTLTNRSEVWVRRVRRFWVLGIAVTAAALLFRFTPLSSFYYQGTQLDRSALKVETDCGLIELRISPRLVLEVNQPATVIVRVHTVRAPDAEQPCDLFIDMHRLLPGAGSVVPSGRVAIRPPRLGELPISWTLQTGTSGAGEVIVAIMGSWHGRNYYLGQVASEVNVEPSARE